MAIMYIYYEDICVLEKEFRAGFYIIRNTESNNLYWKADDDHCYHLTQDYSIHTTGGGTELEIWIIGGSSTRPLIQGLPSHWKLSIDGREMEHRDYDRFAVPGRTISLQYQKCRFECTFLGQATGDVSDVVKPASLR
jgi:hypothetical protein